LIEPARLAEFVPPLEGFSQILALGFFKTSLNLADHEEQRSRDYAERRLLKWQHSAGRRYWEERCCRNEKPAALYSAGAG
jgi:hypothetical protein